MVCSLFTIVVIRQNYENAKKMNGINVLESDSKRRHTIAKGINEKIPL